MIKTQSLVHYRVSDLSQGEAVQQWGFFLSIAIKNAGCFSF